MGGESLPHPSVTLNITVGVKSPPWVGNPFPPLLATLNITVGVKSPPVVIPSPPYLANQTVVVKGNPFPTLLATLNITCGREISSHWGDFLLTRSCQGGGEGIPPHKKGGERISYPWGDFLLTGRVKKGGKGISHPRGILRISHPRGVTGCVKKGGKGIPHPRISHPCVKKGGKGISCPWGVSRRVGKGFPTHGKKGYLRMTILRVAE